MEEHIERYKQLDSEIFAQLGKITLLVSDSPL